ncbi:MAG: arginine repressor [Tannerella sp.]|nr:arginine repressor [Tannerella sp.]
MNAKEQRLYAISEIMHTETIRSQDDLLRSLTEKGFNVTQATLSRDMRQLKVVKTHDTDGFYIYTLPETTSNQAHKTPDAERLNIEFSGNLAVVKTRPGYAMGIASDIDAHAPQEILGTIAGDDTILVIPREGYSREQVANALTRFFP